jgi:ABC-type Co2+ transport system permease subunit
VQHSREPDAHPDAGKLLLPALNTMFDITTTRTAALYTHPPTIIFLMLVVVALASALLAGHGLAASKRRNWFHMVGFAAVITVAVYVILNLEFPRLGVVRVAGFDQFLSALLESMR